MTITITITFIWLQVQQALSKGYRMVCPTHCSPDLYRVMSCCWEEDPNRRPPFPQLVDKMTQLLEQATRMIDIGRLEEDNNYIDILPPDEQELFIDCDNDDSLCWYWSHDVVLWLWYWTLHIELYPTIQQTKLFHSHHNTASAISVKESDSYFYWVCNVDREVMTITVLKFSFNHNSSAHSLSSTWITQHFLDAVNLIYC